MTEPPTCRNCATTQNVMASGLCTLCYLAVTGTAITGQTEEKALAMIRKIRANKRVWDQESRRGTPKP